MEFPAVGIALLRLVPRNARHFPRYLLRGPRCSWHFYLEPFSICRFSVSILFSHLHSFPQLYLPLKLLKPHSIRLDTLVILVLLPRLQYLRQVQDTLVPLAPSELLLQDFCLGLGAELLNKGSFHFREL